MQSISRKVVLLLILVSLPLFLLITSASYLLTSANENSHWQDSKNTINNQLAVILQEPVYSYDKPLIKSIIDSFAADPNIAFIEVLDQRKKTLGKTQAPQNELDLNQQSA